MIAWLGPNSSSKKTLPTPPINYVVEILVSLGAAGFAIAHVLDKDTQKILGSFIPTYL